MSFVRTGFFIAVMLSALGVSGDELRSQGAPFQFHLMEATIPDVHRAIREGQITCRGLVQAYINRAKAYNGTCNRLVSEEMAPTFLPNFSEYQAAMKSTADRPDGDPGKTPPIEFGRMEATASDPTVLQQFGMTVGISNAGQVRACPRPPLRWRHRRRAGGPPHLDPATPAPELHIAPNRSSNANSLCYQALPNRHRVVHDISKR
jgi:amidase